MTYSLLTVDDLMATQLMFLSGTLEKAVVSLMNEGFEQLNHVEHSTGCACTIFSHLCRPLAENITCPSTFLFNVWFYSDLLTFVAHLVPKILVIKIRTGFDFATCNLNRNST